MIPHDHTSTSGPTTGRGQLESVSCLRAKGREGGWKGKRGGRGEKKGWERGREGGREERKREREEAVKSPRLACHKPYSGQVIQLLDLS